MSKFESFIFKNYIFDRERHSLDLFYSYDNQLDFRESYHFDFEFVNYDEAMLDRALQLLFFMAGVSYYKAFLPPKITIEKGVIDEQLAVFLNKTYQYGLREFFYVNKLDPRTDIHFPINTPKLQHLTSPKGRGLSVGIGGGKDSLVSVELLRKGNIEFTTWSLDHRPQLTPLVERIGGSHLWVGREWDRQLLTLKEDPQAYNGHIPISAIFACVGTILAILTGQRDIVVSNESSSNEPTLHYEGIAINHQYSKSLEFETDYQALLTHCFGDVLGYYSFLRPFGELRIAELFAESGFKKYKGVFSSCNSSFVHDNQTIFWDGTCPKCVFVFLALTPFVERQALEEMIGNKNPLLNPELEPTLRQLLGIEGDKPLDCVGEVKESRAAMHMAQQKYPELVKYRFDLPTDYDFRAWSKHSMPAEMYSLLQKLLAE